MSHPLSYLGGDSFQSHYVTPLLWWTIIVSVVVTLVITILVVWGVLRRRAGSGASALQGVPVVPSEGGARWIYYGLAISIVPLLVTLVWTVAVLAKVGPVPARTPLEIDIGAMQFWWDAVYVGEDPDTRFHAANEIHIPVGQPVKLKLVSHDVIHSFWVPRLAGKMDVIPGQTNIVWIRADAPGVYRGQCAEFCGFQHAHMALEVVADPPDRFADWWRAQLRPAAPPRTPEQARGLALLEYRCALCHAVRGTRAGSAAAPDLTHLMSRRMIAAGTLPNNIPALSGWIQDPQGVKPGSLMPAQALSGPQLNDLRAYLETLR
jgi:cytochrome c oxidase subunit 2